MRGFSGARKRALAIGLLTGVFLTLAHAVLPDRWAVLAGTSALWGVVPMLVARRPDARGVNGAVWGMLAMAGTLVPWLAVHADSTSAAEVGLWLLVGPVAGAVCGTAGAASARDGGRGAIGAGVVPGIVAGEAVYGLVLVGGPAWVLELALALVLLAVVSRPAWRAPALGSAVVALALIFLACLGYDGLLS